MPAKVTAKLRLEKAGRGGKSVTVVDGLPDNGPFLEELAKALKKACAVGGTVRPGAIELAGDVARLHSSFVGGIKRVPIRYRLETHAH